MFLRSSFIFYCCLYFISAVAKVKQIDMDYYLSYLRNSNNCSTREGLQNCKNMCKDVPVVCHDDDCYCHQSVVGTSSPTRVIANIAPQQDIEIKVSSQMQPKNDENLSVMMLADEPLRSNRRHQIAHFCPDLDVARQCIRKCVSLGKAAFCGKDHRCYCGHKYSSNDRPDDQNPYSIYKEFADMYAKYLGNSGRDNDSDEDADLLKKKRQQMLKNKKNLKGDGSKN